MTIEESTELTLMLLSYMQTDIHRFRIRRGKIVEIPVEWVGRFTNKKTKNKRNSKLSAKQRHRLKRGKHPDRLAPRHSRVGDFDAGESSLGAFC